MTQREVYLHVGLSKSGTTFLQEALWACRDSLRDAGVLVPGDSRVFQRHGVWDLLGRRMRGVDQPHVPGAWQRLVDAVQEWDGPKVLISEEFLAHSRQRHVRRVVRSLAPAEVHVVATVRDLERTITSMWQQELAMSRTWSLPEYTAAVRDPEKGPSTAAVGFWLRFDILRILSIWESVIPPERIHVVTVPPSGASPDLLPARFAEAVGLQPGALTAPAMQVNTSVGVTEAEVLRRLNVALGGRLNEREYSHLIERVIRPALRERTGPPITLTDDDLQWIKKRAADLADVLSQRSYHVVGDLADLVPHGDPTGRMPEDADEAAVAEAAITALSATGERYAKHWDRRKQKVRRTRSDASRVTKVTSSARALAFKGRRGALELADRNRLASKAANLYLRRATRNRGD